MRDEWMSRMLVQGRVEVRGDWGLAFGRMECGGSRDSGASGVWGFGCLGARCLGA